MKERRQFVRVPRKGLVKFREMHLPQRQCGAEESIYKNISANGLLFESNRNLPIGTILAVQIELRNWARSLRKANTRGFENLPLKVLGEVVRCEQLDSRSAFEIGIHFIGLDPEYQQAILELIQDSLDNS